MGLIILSKNSFGANFVGFRVLPDRIRVRNDNLRRARLRCRQLQQDYTDGQQSLTEVVQRLRSWEAHLMHGDTQRLRRDIFERLIFHPPPEPLSLENSLPVELEMEF